MANIFTDADDVREAFWAAHPHLDRTDLIRNFSGEGMMYRADTRVQFSEFIDSLSRDGRIDHDLAHTITLRG